MEEKNIFSDKTRLFHVLTHNCPFIKSNLISHKLGVYLNTANSCGIFPKMQVSTSFPKEQEDWKLRIHSKTRFQFQNKAARKELKLLTSRSNSLTSNKDGREKKAM